MKIVYWSDYACPYCYIGEARLKKAIKEMGLENQVEIETRAFELDPGAPKTVETVTVERFAKKYQLSIEEAQQQIDHISQLGIDEGIDFRYATTLYTNTRDAHRLTKLAQTKNDHVLENRVSELLFDAYFTRNEKLADHDVLLRVARDAGLDEAEAKAVLESNRFDDEVRFDEREAVMRGVRGVPYFMFNGKFVLPGALSVRAFKHTLEKTLKDLQENTVSVDGHLCGPEGCVL
ncbi:MAG: DsbA family oxidoreductase [Bacteroidales bacterium]|nr:DsbA family oxidoreductase [Bacteroidales bacterium]